MKTKTTINANITTNTKIDPTMLKNTILILIYIFRSLPAGYIDFYFANKEEKQKVWKAIFKLTENGYIKKNSEYGLTFLYLTKKGHTFITTHIFTNTETIPFYHYRTDRMERSSTSMHHFMNFVFIWEWITNNSHLLNQHIKIYEDSDMNHCKLKYRYNGRDLLLYPDVLILHPDESKKGYQKAIIVENDTRTETYKPLFQKFIDYATFIERGADHLAISTIEINYIFTSKKRIETFLSSSKGALQMLRPYNATEKYRSGVSAQTILSAYNKPHVTVSSSAFNRKQPQGSYNFKPYAFTQEIVAYDESLGEKKIGWKTYL
jgi:hypothetical protein